MMMPKDWPIALCMAARLAPPACGQRAYKSTAGNVRFFPSRLIMERDGSWNDFLTAWGELERIEAGDTRLPDAEAARLWATRPQ